LDHDRRRSRKTSRQSASDAEPVQILTWLPSSTTRLAGRLKNSIAVAELRIMHANSRSRHIAMPHNAID
jgi:hypothetical protein